jgi:exodeoxyribonuclease (lambda-induced)
MAHLQQRSEAWYDARRGKITCSNLGALLGQVSYVSRNEAYKRCLGLEQRKALKAKKDGKEVEKPNPACTWGVDNEPNGIVAYMQKTGNYVQATGLHSHTWYPWLAGSPDGFVGDEGLIEVKCPFYKKRDGSSRIHAKVPGHYWMQVNALLEITNRSWCDYISWTPEGFAIFRVHRDTLTFDYLLSYYAAVWACVCSLAEAPPPMSKAERLAIGDRIEEAMLKGVDLTFWRAEIHTMPPAPEDSDREVCDEDEVPSAKRLCVSPESPRGRGEVCDTTDAGYCKAVCTADSDTPFQAAAKALLALRDAQVPMQAVTG